MFRNIIPILIVLTVSIATVAAQQPRTTTSPVTQPAPATQPAGETLPAVVQQVKGKVFYEPPGQPGTWTPVKVGDRLAPGTRIRTMFRSSVIFTLSDTTVVKVDKITVMRINDARRTSEAEHIRIGLEYGEVRAGVAEREIRSDFAIDSPNATLARRGTQDLGIFSERLTQRFTISLAGEGLVEALNRLNGQYRTVYSQQRVTEAMVRWIDQAKFDWLVSIQPIEGMTAIERRITAYQGGSGRGVVEPGASAQVNAIVGGNLAAELQGFLDDTNIPLNVVIRPGRFFNQAGSFGLGGVPSLNELVKDQNLLRRRSGALAPRNRLITRLNRDGNRPPSFRQSRVGRSRVRLR